MGRDWGNGRSWAVPQMLRPRVTAVQESAAKGREMTPVNHPLPFTWNQGLRSRPHLAQKVPTWKKTLPPLFARLRVSGWTRAEDGEVREREKSWGKQKVQANGRITLQQGGTPLLRGALSSLTCPLPYVA